MIVIRHASIWRFVIQARNAEGAAVAFAPTDTFVVDISGLEKPTHSIVELSDGRLAVRARTAPPLMRGLRATAVLPSGAGKTVLALRVAEAVGEWRMLAHGGVVIGDA